MSDAIIYLDTSAYIAILLEGKKGHALWDFIQGKKIISSVLLILEAERNILRLSRERKISPEQYSESIAQIKADIEVFKLKNLNLELCLTNVFPPVQTPRSSDLAHLRTALWFMQNERLDFFITLDEAQRRSAVDCGLPVKIF